MTVERSQTMYESFPIEVREPTARTFALAKAERRLATLESIWKMRVVQQPRWCPGTRAF